MSAIGGIPVKPELPAIELVSARIYSTGSNGKVYTNKAYKALNHNFGIEFSIRNNTKSNKTVSMVGYVYDPAGKSLVTWKSKDIRISPHTQLEQDFFVDHDVFLRMTSGDYKVQFWANGKRIIKKFVHVSQMP